MLVPLQNCTSREHGVFTCSIHLLDVSSYERDEEVHILQDFRATVRTREDRADSVTL